MLIIDLTRLNTGVVEYIDIDEDINIDDEKLNSSEIISLKNTKVVGSEGKEHYLECEITGTMVLPCSMTLKPVDYEFNIKVEGIMEELFEEIGEIVKNNQNTIDILPIIWENILMEIPIKVISPDAVNIEEKGDGWELITDED